MRLGVEKISQQMLGSIFFVVINQHDNYLPISDISKFPLQAIWTSPGS